MTTMTLSSNADGVVGLLRVGPRRGGRLVDIIIISRTRVLISSTAFLTAPVHVVYYHCLLLAALLVAAVQRHAS